MKALRLLVVFVLATALAACSADVPAPPGGGTGGTGGSGASDGSGGVGGQGGMAGASGAGGIGSMGACTVQDSTTLALLDPPNARRIAANCGRLPPCDGESDETGFSNCVSNCVEQAIQQTQADLSSECASCYGDYAWCSRACEDECAADSCSFQCDTCLSIAPNDQCIPDLTQCTGRRMSLDCIDPT